MRHPCSWWFAVQTIAAADEAWMHNLLTMNLLAASRHMHEASCALPDQISSGRAASLAHPVQRYVVAAAAAASCLLGVGQAG